MSLREMRKHMGLSLHEAASAAKVHFTTWSKWERGRVPAERARSVADILHVSVAHVRPDLFTPTPPQQEARS